MKRKLLTFILVFVLLAAASGFAEAASPSSPEPAGTPLTAESASPNGPETAAWYADYLSLLTDASVRKALIGNAADYRTGYFSYDPSALDYQCWRLADLNGDGVPELLMTTSVGLTDLFTWQNGTADYLGYGSFFGFLPASGGQTVVHGHWHGAGGSQRNEWSVSNPFLPEDNRSPIYFDRMGTWSVREGSFSISEDSDAAKAAYDDAFRRYVDACVRLADIPAHAMDEFDGLAEPADLSKIPTFGEMKASFPGDCSLFLLGFEWWPKADFCRDARDYPVLLIDLDGDGLSELLIQNGYTVPEESGAYVFCRRAGKARFVPVGTLPTELRFASDFGDLYGRTETNGAAVWSDYFLTMSGDGIQSYEATWLHGELAEPEYFAPEWIGMRELCEALCNPDRKSAHRITVVSGNDLVDFCPATASEGSTVYVLVMDVTDGSMTGGGAEGGEWKGCFYVFPMPDHDVELHFSFRSNGLA